MLPGLLSPLEQLHTLASLDMHLAPPADLDGLPWTLPDNVDWITLDTASMEGFDASAGDAAVAGSAPRPVPVTRTERYDAMDSAVRAWSAFFHKSTPAAVGAAHPGMCPLCGEQPCMPRSCGNDHRFCMQCLHQGINRAVRTMTSAADERPPELLREYYEIMPQPVCPCAGCTMQLPPALLFEWIAECDAPMEMYHTVANVAVAQVLFHASFARTANA